ncbi:MAG TPA: multicopper oxidase domain-containing protein [Verrucomicrobiae bacterium]|nr:multicopper oxidase domain-containing protein [Verrucomicrobiae bacterium]
MPDPVFPGTTLYQITAGEFEDQLHPDLPPTKLWGYWDTTNPVPRHLGGMLINRKGSPSRVRFTNTLPPQHLLPVDTTVPGAELAQNRAVAHLHGGFVPWISDGGPFAWSTPDGTHGPSFMNGPGSVFDNIPGRPLLPGQADHYYPNGQSTRLGWYHDHAVGITRLNAYAGLASGYVILDDINDAYVAAGKIPGLGSTLPLIFQDKTFVQERTAETDPTWADVTRSDVQRPGSLWYAHVYDPEFYELAPGGLPLPNPSVVPEFFGDSMLCNGTVFPYLTVEAKRYRFLILNACNARFLNINLFRAKPRTPEGIALDPRTQFPTNPPGPAMRQIGTEGGFLVRDVRLNSPKPFNRLTLTGNLLLGPAERADVIVDFSKFEGQEIIMYNDAPAPFPDGGADTDFYLGNPENPEQPVPGTGPETRQILRIRVVPAQTPDPQPPQPILEPALVDPPLLVQPPSVSASARPLPPPSGVPVRDLSLNESFDAHGRLAQLLGTLAEPLPYEAAATEVVPAGSVEVWRIFNFSADTHPIHFHLVNVQVLSRQPFQVQQGKIEMSGRARGPEETELGWKETVKMHPGEVTIVAIRFDLPAGLPFNVPSTPRAAELGLTNPAKTYHEYVWHCHILEHEEHDMMRPLVVES